MRSDGWHKREIWRQSLADLLGQNISPRGCEVTAVPGNIDMLTWHHNSNIRNIIRGRLGKSYFTLIGFYLLFYIYFDFWVVISSKATDNVSKAMLPRWYNWTLYCGVNLKKKTESHKNAVVVWRLKTDIFPILDFIRPCHWNRVRMVWWPRGGEGSDILLNRIVY